MLEDRNGQTVVEWIVIVGIGIVVTGSIIYQVFETLAAKFEAVNTEIGS